MVVPSSSWTEHVWPDQGLQEKIGTSLGFKSCETTIWHWAASKGRGKFKFKEKFYEKWIWKLFIGRLMNNVKVVISQVGPHPKGRARNSRFYVT